MDKTYPLEPNPAEMRAMAGSVTDLLVDFVEGLPGAPAADVEGVDDLRRRLREDAPEEGSALAPLLDIVAQGAGKAFNTTGPGYLAYIPGGGVYSAAVADFLACGINRYVGLWNPAPILAQLEWTTVRWLCDLFGYPEAARGILTSGGSLSNFSAIVTARHARLPEDFLGGTLYATDQVHASVLKAAALAGFPRRNVRTVPATPELRLEPAALREMVAADRAAGLTPFCVVASAGTTNTGAVDDLAELARLAQAEGLWLHVDAAYGGFFQLTERGRAKFRGIEMADSIALDPHKGLFLPYGTGALLVRDGGALRDAHHVGADYLQDLAGEEEVPNFSEYSPELSRDFRGLRVWLPIKLHGLGAFRAALDEKLDLTAYLYEALRSHPRFEVREPDLTVVAFRYRPSGGDGETFNRGLLERINASKRVFLSSTLLEDRFTIRACILCHRTHRDRVEEAAEIILRSAADLDA